MQMDEEFEAYSGYSTILSQEICLSWVALTHICNPDPQEEEAGGSVTLPAWATKQVLRQPERVQRNPDSKTKTETTTKQTKRNLS